MAFFFKHCSIRIQLLRRIAAIATHMWVTHAKRSNVLKRVFATCVLFCLFQQTATAQGLHIPEPTPPPAAVIEAFDLDTSFYKQWIDVEGYPVLASANTSPYAVKEAAYLIRRMVGHRPEMLRAMGANGCRFLIMAWNEMISEIPEYSDMRPVYYWHDIRGRGLGGCHASTSEENLLRYPNTTFPTGSILMHEFAHAVHDSGLSLVDPGFDARLNGIYRAAMAEGLWDGTYAQVNRNEYWAEGTEAWLNPQYPMPPDAPTQVDDPRAALKRYDPRLAVLLTEIYGDRDWRLTPVATRTHEPHLQGFDPQNTPTYQNPPETVALAREFTKNPKSTGDGRWVNLAPYPLRALQRLQAERHEGDPTIIFFGNYGTDDFLYIYWIAPDGTEHFRGRVRRDMRNYDTKVGSLWLLKDETGAVLGVYRAEAPVSRVLPDMARKIEGPWLWMIAPTRHELLGSEAAASGTDFLAVASHGAVTEQAIATHGAIAGTAVRDKVWTAGKLAPTGERNIAEMVNAIGLANRDYIEYHVAYGSIALNVPREQSTVMHVGSDDAVKVWLNGVLVHNNPIDRGADDYKETFSVKLKKGRNILLVAVYQGWGGWSGFFGFKKGTAYRIHIPPIVHINPAQRPPLYWIDTETGTLHRLVWDTVQHLVPNVENAISLAVDTKSHKLYWTERREQDKGHLKRANLDGSNVQFLAALQSVPTSIAVDAAQSKLYWTTASGHIQRATLQGEHIQTLIENLQAPDNITVDAAGRKLYWTEASERIRRAALDGKSIQNIANHLDTIADIVVADNKLYWTEGTAGCGGKIKYVSLNGLNFGTLVSLQVVPSGLAVDPVGKKVYWAAADGKIRRANFNDKNIQNVVSDVVSPAALVLGNVSTGPAAPVNTSLTTAQTTVPDATRLLANYPNPSNPETWIPYQLAAPNAVKITIYDTRGTVMRRLDLGHQPIGTYTSRTRAAYWDGRNALGEPVASGVYFYTLTAGDFTATRKMLIVK